MGERVKAGQGNENKGSVCHLCGGRGLVYLGYVKPDVELQRKRDEVPCPKCSQSHIKSSDEIAKILGMGG